MGINRIKYVNVDSGTQDSNFIEFENMGDITASIKITENGTYYAPDDIIGYKKVIVDVYTVNNQDITITENGEYTASAGYTGFGTVTVEVPEPELESVVYTSNGVYTPPAGVYGYNQVEVDVQPPLENIEITENGTYTASSNYYGFGQVKVSTPVINNQNLYVTTNGVYTAEQGYSGLGTVEVQVADVPAVIEPISITPTTSQQIIYAPANVDGYSPITVSAVDNTIDSNIAAGNIKSGINILGVTGNVVELNGTTATITPSTNSQTISPTSPYNAFTEVTVDAVDATIDSNIVSGNIKSGVEILGVTGSVIELNGQTTTVTPTTSQQTITPTSPHNGLTEVVVDAVDANIDANIIPGNIKSGVSILGVTGNVEELNGETLSITPSTSSQTFTPTGVHNGYTQVDVSAVDATIDPDIVPGNIIQGVNILGISGSAIKLNAQGLSVTPSTSAQTISPTSPYNAFDEVSVSAVTSAIDNNITSGNIKSGVSILGVAGNLTPLNADSLSVTPSTTAQTIYPTSPYNAFNEVSVAAVTAAIDANIISRPGPRLTQAIELISNCIYN